MKLTAKEALEKSIQLWEIIAREGCMKVKAMEELGEKEKILYNCYLCEYAFNNTCHKCQMCPVAEWRTYNPTILSNCEIFGSPYEAYFTAVTQSQPKKELIRKSAEAVLDLLKESLESKNFPQASQD